MTDLLATVHIKDLSTPIATRSDESPVMAETNTAHNALMGKIVHQFDGESTIYIRIEYGMPVIALVLVMRRELVEFIIGELVADGINLRSRILKIGREVGVRSRRRRCTTHRCMGRTCIRVGLCLMGSSGSS